MATPSANNAAAVLGVRGHETTPSSYTLSEEGDQRRFIHELLAFWKKINYDWIFNLAGLLAYNFLMALFPHPTAAHRWLWHRPESHLATN